MHFKTEQCVHQMINGIKTKTMSQQSFSMNFKPQQKRGTALEPSTSLVVQIIQTINKQIELVH